ncbi:MAG: class I SAM-dependent methyltransferase [Planctomycetes bacterium]|nr:class I SAM-dependent methyltransferase [Planctomycetota bacterium]
MSSKRKRRRPPQRDSLAARAEKYDLYQRSVQTPYLDAAFFVRVFKKTFGRPPRTLREDFCAAAHLSCAWVESHRENRAYGFDLDSEPLAWGLEHNAGDLSLEQQSRLHLEVGNALAVREPKVDMVAAFNFSYCVFKARKELLAYFHAARKNLRREGLFFLDVMGGPESQVEITDRRRIGGFSYVWEQEYFDAITGEIRCSISFRFRDGSVLKKPFRYDWRLWTIPELRDIAAEAGFRDFAVYWEGTESDTGEGNGAYTRREHAENCDSWVAIIVCRK